jgi:GNAT superfamily N-acetyltransferase
LNADDRAAVGRSEAWLAGDDAVPVGLLVLVPTPGYLRLENVAVIPAQQGRGIGTRLLGFADERARDVSLPEVRPNTNAAMTENVTYYGRHGYTESHRAEEHGFSRVYFSRLLPEVQAR